MNYNVRTFSVDEVVGGLPELRRAEIETAGSPRPASSHQPRPTFHDLIDWGLTRCRERGRNETVLDVLCQARDAGYAEAECEAKLPELVRRFDGAAPKEHPYTLDEARSTLNQVFGRPPREPWPIDGAYAVSFSDIKPEAVEYLILGRVPKRMLTLLGGHAGRGKSMLTATWAAAVSTGGMFGSAAGVLWLNAEDSASVTSRPRLEAAGADLSRVRDVRMRREGEEVGLTIPDDIGEIERLILKHEAGLVILDPINNFFPAHVNAWRDTDVRRVLGPLAQLAERTGVAIIIVAHLTKAETKEVIHRFSGSVAYGGQVRSALVFDHDPDDPDGDQGLRRVLAHVKFNVGPLAPSLLYHIEEFTTSSGIKTARLVGQGVSPRGAADILNRRSDPTESKLQGAIEVLRSELGDGDWHRAADVKAVAEEFGYSQSTIERAKRALGVEMRTGKSYPPERFWRLSPADDDGPVTHPDEDDHDGTGTAP